MHEIVRCGEKSIWSKANQRLYVYRRIVKVMIVIPYKIMLEVNDNMFVSHLDNIYHRVIITLLPFFIELLQYDWL